MKCSRAAGESWGQRSPVPRKRAGLFMWHMGLVPFSTGVKGCAKLPSVGWVQPHSQNTIWSSILRNRCCPWGVSEHQQSVPFHCWHRRHLGRLRYPTSEIFPKGLAGRDKSLGLDLTTLLKLWNYKLMWLILETPILAEFPLPGLGYLPCLPDNPISSYRLSCSQRSFRPWPDIPCRVAIGVAFLHSAKALHREPVGNYPQLGFTHHECPV